MRKPFLFLGLLLLSVASFAQTYDTYKANYAAGYQAGQYSMKTALESNPSLGVTWTLTYYTIGTGYPNITIAQVDYSTYQTAGAEDRFMGYSIMTDPQSAAIGAYMDIVTSAYYASLEELAQNGGPGEQGTFDGYKQALTDLVINPGP